MELQRIFGYDLVKNPLFFMFFVGSSCSLCFSIFEGLWWKFFGALEASIRRVSPNYGFLKFLEDFDLDSGEL